MGPPWVVARDIKPADAVRVAGECVPLFEERPDRLATAGGHGRIEFLLDGRGRRVATGLHGAFEPPVLRRTLVRAEAGERLATCAERAGTACCVHNIRQHGRWDLRLNSTIEACWIPAWASGQSRRRRGRLGSRACGGLQVTNSGCLRMPGVPSRHRTLRLSKSRRRPRSGSAPARRRAWGARAPPGAVVRGPARRQGATAPPQAQRQTGAARREGAPRSLRPQSRIPLPRRAWAAAQMAAQRARQPLRWPGAEATAEARGAPAGSWGARRAEAPPQRETVRSKAPARQERRAPAGAGCCPDTATDRRERSARARSTASLLARSPTL